MPNLNIKNTDTSGNAEIENGAQVNKIEIIYLNNEELKPDNNRAINIPIASQEDVQNLFIKEEN